MRLHAPRFSLAHTLESGQLFRFETVAEGFLISHRDKAFVISHDGDFLTVHAATPNVTEAWLTHFFALDMQPPKPVDAFSRDALAYCSGMRICRQDPWECTVGFLCSQNNNIKRIRQLMTGLANAFGTKVAVGNYETHLFPNPGQIRAGKKLAAIRAGYREKYLLAANKHTDEWLASLYTMTADEKKASLLGMHGIGPKVADCILLFAYGEASAFPIDTWVEQIMKEQYGVANKQLMQQKATELFGASKGIMQQYLFHYRRQL